VAQLLIIAAIQATNHSNWGAKSMSNKDDTSVVTGGNASSEPDNERREALIKLGKYAAYAAPIVLASMSTVQAAPASSPSPPSPSPV
jgi:hypothetical protein